MSGPAIDSTGDLRPASVDTPGDPFLTDAIGPYLAAIEAAGIRAIWDIKSLNPPCVYIPAPELAWRFKGHDFDASFTALVVAGNTDRRLALDEMSALLYLVQQALGGRVQSARAVDVPTNDGTAVLLGYELTWSDRIRRRPAP
jgi:hypothetical protein